MSVREQLDWESRWARPAAAAAFASVGFNVAASVYVSASIDSRPDADNTRELLRTIDANAGVFTTGAALSGIAGLLLGGFRHARARVPAGHHEALGLERAQRLPDGHPRDAVATREEFLGEPAAARVDTRDDVVPDGRAHRVRGNTHDRPPPNPRETPTSGVRSVTLLQ